MVKYSSFGTLPFGHELFGGILLDEQEINRVLERILQRYPRGFAWKGKNLQAITRAFALEFYTLQKNAIAQAQVNNFFKEYAIKSGKNISLPSIEKALHSAGFTQAQLFYTTGERKYIAPKAASSTQFGNEKGMFGRGMFGGHYHKPHPKDYPHGSVLHTGRIDFLLNKVETPDNEAIAVWNLITNNRNTQRFVFYVGRIGNFLSPIRFENQEQYLEFRRILIEHIPFGMFGIINYDIWR